MMKTYLVDLSLPSLLSLLGITFFLWYASSFSLPSFLDIDTLSNKSVDNIYHRHFLICTLNQIICVDFTIIAFYVNVQVLLIFHWLFNKLLSYDVILFQVDSYISSIFLFSIAKDMHWGFFFELKDKSCLLWKLDL